MASKAERQQNPLQRSEFRDVEGTIHACQGCQGCQGLPGVQETWRQPS